MRRRDLLTALSCLPLGVACKPKEEDYLRATGDVVVGHYASMTGNTAHFGQDTDKAARLAFDEVNARGGIRGRRLRLVTFDDRGDSAEAANAIERLIDLEDCVALLGEVASSLSLAGGRIAQRRRVPMLATGSTNPQVTRIGDYVFRVCFIDPFQGKVMASFARKHLQLGRVALLRDVRSDYSKGLSEAFRKAFRDELGGEIVVEQSYAQGDTDFSAQLTAIKNSTAQAIFVPGYYSEAGAIARTAQRLGMRLPLLGGDGWDAPDLFKIAGDALDGSFYSNHFAPDMASPEAKRFVTSFTHRYGKPPTGLGALGYDGALVMADALRRAPSTKPSAIRDALAQTRDVPGVTGRISIGPDRNPIKSAVVLRVGGGGARYEAMIDP